MSRTALVLVLLLGVAPAVAGATDGGAPARLVTVNGSGEVSAAPDRATVSLGVLARQPTLEAARSEANQVATALLALTRELAIPAAQVHSTRVSVNPEYKWNGGQRERRPIAYTVLRQLIVDLRDLDQLGVLLEKAISLGANQVGDPRLDCSRRADLEREALARAVEDAAHNAATLARAADATLGAVRSLAMAGGGEPGVPMERMLSASASRSEAPQSYQAGDMTFSATVTASYELVPGTASR